eukprot:1157588-Pelagomonas_calceolata.AAC.8
MWRQEGEGTHQPWGKGSQKRGAAAGTAAAYAAAAAVTECHGFSGVGAGLGACESGLLRGDGECQLLSSGKGSRICSLMSYEGCVGAAKCMVVEEQIGGRMCSLMPYEGCVGVATYMFGVEEHAIGPAGQRTKRRAL